MKSKRVKINPDDIVVRLTKTSNISTSTLKTLRKLTFARTGIMRRLILPPFDVLPVIIAKYDNEIVGWGIFEDIDPDVCTSFSLYVKPLYRRNGVGTKILKRAAKYNSSMIVYNTSSRGFYKKFGAKFERNRMGILKM